MTPEHWPEGLGSSADGAGPTSRAFVVNVVTSVCVFNALVDSLLVLITCAPKLWAIPRTRTTTACTLRGSAHTPCLLCSPGEDLGFGLKLSTANLFQAVKLGHPQPNLNRS